MNRFLSLACLFFSFFSHAETSGRNSLSSLAPLPTDSHFSFILPSFVVHGYQPAQSAATAMPRKLVANGDAVVTPGLGIQSVSEGGFLMLGALVKDCYDNMAGTFQIGQDFKLSKESHLALSAGFYIRQTPLNCDASFNLNGGCSLRDKMSSYFVKKLGDQWVDVIPMPFIHYSYSIYKDRDLEVKGKIIANFLLNEVGLEIPF